jgi:hypothetical protein
MRMAVTADADLRDFRKGKSGRRTLIPSPSPAEQEKGDALGQI